MPTRRFPPRPASSYTRPALPLGFYSRAPVTLPPVRVVAVTDEDLGLPYDPIAQVRAEEFIRAAIAYRLKQEQVRAQAASILPTDTAVHVEVPDDALALIDPTDRLTPDEAGILSELRRLCGMQAVETANVTAA